MHASSAIAFSAIVATTLIVSLAACSKPPKPAATVDQPERAAEVLRAGVPTEHLEFNDPEDSFPPRPKGYTEFTTVPVTGARELTAERIASLRKVALADARVRDALAERYIHLQSGEVDAPKPPGTDTGTAQATVLYKLQFYSYTNGNTVNVLLEPGDAIRAVEVNRDQHPPESPEEIAAARVIVIEQAKMGRELRALATTGILSDPLALKLPADARVLYLTFNSPDNLIRHVAWVDMRAGKLIKDGPPPTEQTAVMPAHKE